MLTRDLREAVRSLLKQPAFSVVVVGTLALGIGANTAVFSLINAILLRPFPYREPGRLVKVQSFMVKEKATRGCSLRDVEDYRRRSRTLAGIGSYTSFDSDIRPESGPAQPITLAQLHPQALSLVGVNPIVGRLFSPEEDFEGGDVHKAILSYSFWQNYYGADPNVIGKQVRTNQTSLTIVGVMPPSFAFPERTDVWTTMESYYTLITGWNKAKPRSARFYNTIARLKPGVTIEQAQAELESIAAQLAREYPVDNADVAPRLTPLRDAEVGNIRPHLIALMTAVGFVLLICCANVANLLLARGAARYREISIRAALGASRWRVIRSLLVESIVLSIAGAIAGIALAFAGVRGLVAMIPERLPFWMRIEVDPPVLIATLAVSLFTGLLFGFLPALQASRVDLLSVLKEGVRGSTASGGRLRQALVVSEVALSLVLLVGAGLMMQTFLRLQNRDTGFQASNLLVAKVTRFRGGTREESAAASAQVHDRMLVSIRRVPGVVSTGGANNLPYTSTSNERRNTALYVKGQNAEDLKRTARLAGADVTPGYLETMGIRLLEGRTFDRRDTPGSQMTIIINQRAAEVLFPGRDALGQQILWGNLQQGAENPYTTVVGVVANVKHIAAEDDAGIEFYYPHTQYPISTVHYVIRTSGQPANAIPAVRQAIREADPVAPIVFIKPMETIIDERLWQRRLWGMMFAIFAGLALLLACVGIYGVMSYSVNQRTREIGIRMALGAERSSVLALVVRHGMAMVLGGVALGLAASFALVRFIRSLLFGVSAFDPPTFLAVAGLLIAVALGACLIPARRASAVDPTQALRAD
jgi:putative ABC transport system permease protein